MGQGKKRILLVVAYDGTDYNGFAAQKNPDAVTIEGTLNQVLSDLTGEEIHVIGASRTDAGVHALCNYCVFDTKTPIPPDKICMAVNTRLPEDIRVRKSKEVDPQFHPRNAAAVKTYEYHIYNAKIPDPLRARYSAFTYFHLDVERMRKGAAYLVGEHDFKSFCNTASKAESTVREILGIDIEEKEIPVPHIMYSVKKHTPAEQDEAREIVIRVRGRGFLYNMVRIIAGTLMDVGRGNREPEQVKQMLEAKDRAAAGKTAPACGLILTDYQIISWKKEDP